MESKEERKVNMLKLLLLCLSLSIASARVHHLRLEDDVRKQITVSTFGFLSGGTLAINITSFSYAGSEKSRVDPITYNRTAFGFTLDKSKSDGLSSYMEGMQQVCILNKGDSELEKDEMQSLLFKFDFNNKKVHIVRVGSDMQKLLVTERPRNDFLIDKHLNRRDTGRAEHNLNFKLSDNYLLGSRRRRAPEAASAQEATTPKPPIKPVEETENKTTTAVLDMTSSTTLTTDKPIVSEAATGTQGKATEEEKGDLHGEVSGDAQGELVSSVALNELSDGSYQVYFLVYIRNPQEEGLYNLFFHNCLSYTKLTSIPIALTMDITEDNNGNFLTAGEMPVPALYFTFCVLFFIAGVAWWSVLRKSTEGVFKIHYLMLVVVFVKSLACLFHGVNMYFIQITGIHEDAWAIMWYIVYLTRGALMLVTVLLIGSGWAFIKHVFSDKEKKLFLIIIPLQILNGVAKVIVEESEEGNESYSTWNQIFILVDLLCCGAILFPVVWSIRHLQDASRTDGKAAINLQKLKLFRHFYILVVCYIYFTRIIVYLMKITVPFKMEWITDMFTELAMLVFFVVTGIKFRPASDNPYLLVPLDSDDEIEMDEVLTKTGETDNVVRVNQKSAPPTEGVTNQMKQRESSHDYD